MTLEELLAYFKQQAPQQANPYYNAQQVGGQGILGAGLRNRAGQIEQQTGGMPPPTPQPMQPPAGLLGGAPVQQMSPPPQAGAGDASKQAMIAAILASGDKTRIAQLRHAGLIP